ncbi:MAG: hypothetical protein OES57_10100 [Acidimicrobiia bacterium]|nr:hypothetical protein [Acidimicrobiia bacterium]
MTTQDELRERLSALAEAADHDVPDPIEVYRQAQREAQRRRRRQSWVFAAAAALLVGVVVVGALVIAAGDEGGDTRVRTDPEPTVVDDADAELVPETTPPPTEPVESPAARSEIVLGPTATGVSVGGLIRERVSLVTDDAWWGGGDDGTVIRLDPVTREIEAAIEVPGSSGMDVGAGSIWVGTGEGGQIVRIDEATNEIVATIDLGIGTSSGHFAFGSLWAIHTDDGLVSRIDAETNEVVAEIEVGGTPRGETGDHAGSIWVADYENERVLRIDPETDTLESVVPVPEGFSNYDATEEGGVWVGVSSLDAIGVGRIDPVTNTLGDLIPAAGVGGGLYVDADNVWHFVQRGCGSGSCELAVARIDPVAGEVIDVIDLSGLIDESGGIWGGGDVVLASGGPAGAVPLYIGDPD